jgi:hypothetical protein
VAGLSFTLCSCRPLPQLKVARDRSTRGPTESERSAVTVHLRARLDAGWDECLHTASCPHLCQFYSCSHWPPSRRFAAQRKSLLRGASLKRPVKNRSVSEYPLAAG